MAVVVVTLGIACLCYAGAVVIAVMLDLFPHYVIAQPLNWRRGHFTRRGAERGARRLALRYPEGAFYVRARREVYADLPA